MQQGRFDRGLELARKRMREAIRQHRQHAAGVYLKLAISGLQLQHSDGLVEVLEEYKRFDSDYGELPAGQVPVVVGQVPAG